MGNWEQAPGQPREAPVNAHNQAAVEPLRVVDKEGTSRLGFKLSSSHVVRRVGPQRLELIT